MHAGFRLSRARTGSIALLLAGLIGLAAAGCTATGRPSETTGPDSSQDGGGADMDGATTQPAQEVDFDAVMGDPEAFVGSRIRVTGNVFFHSVCPPPGATGSTCVLLGYLTDPGKRTFIAADEADALALAENGVRVSCEEVGSSRACEGWQPDSTYTLEGVLEHQVLGGRETDLVQLEVEEKSDPRPW